jgi:hypothetical protein
MEFTQASPATSGASQDRVDIVAIIALVRALKAWRANAQESATLVAVSERTWARMKSEDWNGELSQDQRLRASALIGLYKGLHLYFGDALADKWVKMPNQGPLFRGQSPMQYILAGALPAMMETREYVDAVRGGL